MPRREMILDLASRLGLGDNCFQQFCSSVRFFKEYLDHRRPV